MIRRYAPLIRSLLWTIILVFVLLFWPREIPEPEVIVKTEIVYVYVYNESDLPEEFISENQPRYGFTDDDIYLMTVLLCGSEKVAGDGEYDIDFGNKDNHDQISLVLSVVMNRVMSDKFPNTVEEVIWARGQFTPMTKWKNGLPKVNPESYEIVKNWCEAYDNHDLSIISIPEDHLYFTGNGVINRSRARW